MYIGIKGLRALSTGFHWFSLRVISFRIKVGWRTGACVKCGAAPCVTGSLGIGFRKRRPSSQLKRSSIVWLGLVKDCERHACHFGGAPSGQNIIMKWQARGQIKSALNLPLITNHTAASGCSFPRKLYQKPSTGRGSGLKVIWGYEPPSPSF